VHRRMMATAAPSSSSEAPTDDGKLSDEAVDVSSFEPKSEFLKYGQSPLITSFPSLSISISLHLYISAALSSFGRVFAWK
jgi:hypothetical protein